MSLAVKVPKSLVKPLLHHAVVLFQFDCKSLEDSICHLCITLGHVSRRIHVHHSRLGDWPSILTPVSRYLLHSVHFLLLLRSKSICLKSQLVNHLKTSLLELWPANISEYTFSELIAKEVVSDTQDVFTLSGDALPDSFGDLMLDSQRQVDVDPVL